MLFPPICPLPTQTHTCTLVKLYLPRTLQVQVQIALCGAGYGVGMEALASPLCRDCLPGAEERRTYQPCSSFRTSPAMHDPKQTLL